MSPLPSAWDALLGHPFDREPHRSTLAAAEAAAARETVYPPREDWFAAFRLTPPEKVRAVILGQDPYHEPGQAMGLAFSVRAGVKLPPSLRNIYKELEADLGFPAPASGDLRAWAEQGVLLLNTVLTVAAGKADSHRALGWQAFTGEVIAAVAALPRPVAFVLWGAPARRACHSAVGAAIGRPPEASASEMQSAKCKVQNERSGKTFPLGGRLHGESVTDEGSLDKRPGPRLILEAPHPSPLSAYRGFFGSRPFSQINAFLEANGEKAIRWTALLNETMKK